MENLRLRADKSVLEDLLNEAAGLDLGSYTEESSAAFRTALASARAVFADLTLTAEDQQTVDVAVTALRQAKAGLVEKSTGTDDPADTGNTGNNGNQNGTAGDNTGNNGTTAGSNRTTNVSGNAGGSSNSNSKAAKTGEETPFTWMLILMAAAGTVVAVAVRRKCEN